jgi:hypothetical protein
MLPRSFSPSGCSACLFTAFALFIALIACLRATR